MAYGYGTLQETLIHTRRVCTSINLAKDSADAYDSPQYHALPSVDLG
jgi:hypothetical protein